MFSRDCIFYFLFGIKDMSMKKKNISILFNIIKLYTELFETPGMLFIPTYFPMKYIV